jgi:inorganic pyrophosphatase
MPRDAEHVLFIASATRQSSHAYARSEMTNYLKLPTWADSSHVHAVVETPRGSRAKLEFDPKLGAFTLAKPLLTGLTYPYDWGFIPSTKAEDGDPLDVLIIHDAATYPGLVLTCNPSACSKSCNRRRARRSETTVCSLYLIVLPSR